MKIRAAEALANYVVHPTVDMVIPGPFDPGIADVVAEAMAN